MEDFTMVDFWKFKLHELRLIETQMKMDRNTTEEDLRDMNAMIQQARHELASAIREEEQAKKAQEEGVKGAKAV